MVGAQLIRNGGLTHNTPRATRVFPETRARPAQLSLQVAGPPAHQAGNGPIGSAGIHGVPPAPAECPDPHSTGRKLRLREGESHPQGHTAGNGQAATPTPPGLPSARAPGPPSPPPPCPQHPGSTGKTRGALVLWGHSVWGGEIRACAWQARWPASKNRKDQ